MYVVCVAEVLENVYNLVCGPHYCIDLGLSTTYLTGVFTHTPSSDANCQSIGIW